MSQGMQDRCPLNRLPKRTLESGEGDFVWVPKVPESCLRLCIHPTFANRALSKQCTSPDDTDIAKFEEGGVSLEDGSLAWSRNMGIRVDDEGDPAQRHIIEESYPDCAPDLWYTTEVRFGCHLEKYEPTPREGDYLQRIVDPESFAKPDGRDDILTRYFYDKALEGEPLPLLVALLNCEDLLERHNDGRLMMSELNELRVDRLLVMVADMPAEIDLLTKIDAWQVVLEADWLHWVEEKGSTERAIIRLVEHDVDFLIHLQQVISGVIRLKLKLLREQTGFDHKVNIDEIDTNTSNVMSYVADTYPDALMTWTSLVALRKAQQTVADYMPRKPR